MGSYTSSKASSSVKSNASAETFTFDISSALTSANIPAYATITSATITVWGDIDTSTSRGKMTATFGSTSICSDVWAGGSAGEVSKSASIASHINSGNANAGKLKVSTDRLTIVLDGPVMLSKFNHTASWQLKIEWTNHSHSWNSGSVTKSATCMSSGTKTYTCTVCGATKTETIAQLPHSYTGEVVFVSGGKTGTHAYKCVNGCDNYGGAVNHTFEYDRTIEATCTKEGEIRYRCSECGHMYAEAIPALGHTQVTISAVAPTCTETGLTEGKKCSVCGTVTVAQQTVPALGHNYSSVVTQPTSTSNGYTTHTCSRCGHSYADTYTCKVTVSCDTTMGTVTGGGVYSQNGTATLTATPKTGYKFVKWNDGNTNASRTVTVNNSVTYTAVFEKLPPEFTSASMTYLNKQISSSNKVICNEGFIISVGVT